MSLPTSLNPAVTLTGASFASNSFPRLAVSYYPFTFRDADHVIKYGIDIGRVVQPIAKGQHAHVHNIKTKRW